MNQAAIKETTIAAADAAGIQQTPGSSYTRLSDIIIDDLLKQAFADRAAMTERIAAAEGENKILRSAMAEIGLIVHERQQPLGNRLQMIYSRISLLGIKPSEYDATPISPSGGSNDDLKNAVNTINEVMGAKDSSTALMSLLRYRLSVRTEALKDVLRQRTENNSVILAAQRWMAVLNSARIRRHGWSGFPGQMPADVPDDGYRHVSLALYSTHREGNTNELGESAATDSVDAGLMLSDYADTVIAIANANAKKGAVQQ